MQRFENCGNVIFMPSVDQSADNDICKHQFGVANNPFAFQAPFFICHNFETTHARNHNICSNTKPQDPPIYSVFDIYRFAELV